VIKKCGSREESGDHNVLLIVWRSVDGRKRRRWLLRSICQKTLSTEEGGKKWKKLKSHEAPRQANKEGRELSCKAEPQSSSKGRKRV